MDEALSPRGPVAVSVLSRGGQTLTLQTTAAIEAQREVALLRNGGVIPTILKPIMADSAY